MIKQLSLSLAAFAMGSASLVVAAPAEAQGRYYSDRYDRGDRYDRREYRQERRAYRNNRRGYRNQRCNDGTTGAVVGAIAGGLLGRTIDTRGDRTLGTLGGAVLGGLGGRAIERSDRRGGCR